ncbi:MAG: hypothetical protein U5L46_05090 [Agrobacterium sp.]|nr:hypothetical protein [Agrobacterium sp.]
MAMIHYHPAANRSSHRPATDGWFQRLSGQISALHASWHRARMLRALEALPPETLKDIGWPASDSDLPRVIRK